VLRDIKEHYPYGHVWGNVESDHNKTLGATEFPIGARHFNEWSDEASLDLNYFALTQKETKIPIAIESRHF